MVNMLELTCVQCGKLFLRSVASVNKANRNRKLKTGPFCGAACSNIHRCKGKRLSEKTRKKLMGRRPWNKGKPWSKAMRQKLSQLASNGNRAMENNGHWQGGRHTRPDGYITIRVNGRPKMEHRHVMEQYLGRKLKQSELVHHENGDRTDNRIENLRLCTASTHMKHHNPHGPLPREVKRVCVICGATFNTRRHQQKVCSATCKKKRQRLYAKRYNAKRKAKRLAQRADSR